MFKIYTDHRGNHLKHHWIHIALPNCSQENTTTDRHVELHFESLNIHFYIYFLNSQFPKHQCCKNSFNIMCPIKDRLCYCNCLLFNVHKELMSRLQRVQCNAAKIFLGTKRHQAAPLQKELLVKARIVYKLLTITFDLKWDTSQSRYLHEKLELYVNDILF